MSSTYNLLDLLENELVPAVGCTEPAAVIFTAAKVRDVMGDLPEKLFVQCGASLYKNAKGVPIPNTQGRMGIEIGVCLGIVMGGSSDELSIPERITQRDVERALTLVNSGFCTLEVVDTEKAVFLTIEAQATEKTVQVTLEDAHTHISKIVLNGEVLCESDPLSTKMISEPFGGLTFDDIYRFASHVEFDAFESLIRKQVEMNMAATEDGMENDQKLNLGNILLERWSGDSLEKGIAYAGAGCDARMSGATVPVCSIGGSGTQSIASSVPLCVYCEKETADEEEMLRAVLLSDLVFLYIKKGIGRLSAYCSAAASAAAVSGSIAYLKTGDIAQVKRAILNTLANVSGILCDGAKISCALKVVTCLKGAALSVDLVDQGSNVDYSLGILGEDFEESIRNVGIVASKGMKPTNDEIIALMHQGC